MTQPLPDPAEQIRQLTAELDAAQRREAWFRLKTAQDFLVLDTQLKSHRQKVEAQRAELDGRDSTIHALHLQDLALKQAHQKALDDRDAVLHELNLKFNAQTDELHRTRGAHTLALLAAEEKLRATQQEIRADVQAFMEQLRASEDDRTALRQEINRLKSTWGWDLVAPLRRLQKKYGSRPSPVPAPAPDLPAGAFFYYLHTSPYRLYRPEPFTLRGWALPHDGRKVTALRVRAADREFPAELGLEEPGVAARHGHQPNNPHPGFALTFTLPAGRHHLRLEAQLDGRDWFSILTTPVWCQPA